MIWYEMSRRIRKGVERGGKEVDVGKRWKLRKRRKKELRQPDRLDRWSSKERVSVVVSQGCAKRVVFAVFVSWEREASWRRTPGEECSFVKARLPEGSAVFIGCSDGWLGGMNYDAVILLRGKLARCGQLVEWLELGDPWEGSGTSGTDLLEPWEWRSGSNWKLEEFLSEAQQFCRRGGSTYGTVIGAGSGDVRKLALLESMSAEERELGSSAWMDMLRARMPFEEEEELRASLTVEEIVRGAVRRNGMD